MFEGLGALVLALSSSAVAGESIVEPKEPIKIERSEFYKDKIEEAKKYHAENKEFEAFNALEGAAAFERKYGKGPNKGKNTKELDDLARAVIAQIKFHYTKLIEAERLIK